MKRRSFLYSSLLMTAACATPINKITPKKRPKVLVLGGTGNYLGPTMVRELLKEGYEVVLFNRGITNKHLFPNLERIYGDRETQNGKGLKNLINDKRDWDFVIDTWQKSPKSVYDAVLILKQRTKLYQYISSISVYDDWHVVGIDENEALNPTPEFRNTIETPDRYAIRKTISENLIREYMPDNHSIFRSHGLRGYPNGDNKIHEPYWAVKIARGGDIIVPAEAEYYQVTDSVSLARFAITAARKNLTGSYNVAYQPFLFKDFLNKIIEVTNSNAKLHWLPQETLAKYDVALWRTNRAGRYRFDISKAIDVGLVNRPLEELISDQLKGYYDRNPNDDFKFIEEGTLYLSDETEKRILKEWYSKA